VLPLDVFARDGFAAEPLRVRGTVHPGRQERKVAVKESYFRDRTV
jgi:hypothetical protein